MADVFKVGGQFKGHVSNWGWSRITISLGITNYISIKPLTQRRPPSSLKFVMYIIAKFMQGEYIYLNVYLLISYLWPLSRLRSDKLQKSCKIPIHSLRVLYLSKVLLIMFICCIHIQNRKHDYKLNQPRYAVDLQLFLSFLEIERDLIQKISECIVHL